MSFPPTDGPLSTSPRSIHGDHDGSPTRFRSPSVDSDANVAVRRSPTLSRSFNPMDPDARERQRTLDVDMAMHLSRARRESISVSPVASPLTIREHDARGPEAHVHHEDATFPGFSLQEEQELSIARGEILHQPNHSEAYQRTPTPDDLRLNMDMGHHLAQTHDTALLGTL
ncbi:hypothetical protein BC834DRAFT_824319, partial [Gloeopeniophorella convolvens]